MSVRDIAVNPVHLGLGATAESEPEFTGDMAWYEAYINRHASDGAEGRLVSMHTFSKPWDMWEMHPKGSELVLCVSGSMTLYREFPDGKETSDRLGPGEYAVNEPGVWHTADTESGATALFITAGLGTEHRQR